LSSNFKNGGQQFSIIVVLDHFSDPSLAIYPRRRLILAGDLSSPMDSFGRYSKEIFCRKNVYLIIDPLTVTPLGLLIKPICLTEIPISLTAKSIGLTGKTLI
jgi:hypothetical protein